MRQEVFHGKEGEELFLRWSFDVQNVYVAGSTAGTTGSDLFTPVARDTAAAELEKLAELE